MTCSDNPHIQIVQLVKQVLTWGPNGQNHEDINLSNHEISIWYRHPEIIIRELIGKKNRNPQQLMKTQFSIPMPLLLDKVTHDNHTCKHIALKIHHRGQHRVFHHYSVLGPQNIECDFPVTHQFYV